jgi:hypothetical protein
MALVLSVVFSSCAGGATPKKAVESILIEAVDAETQGERAGDTHFTLGLYELFYSYENFDSAEESFEKLRERSELASLVMEKGEIRDAKGTEVGSYRLTSTNSSPTNQIFCLLWSKASRFAKVCSESVEGIEQFRNQYEL